MEKGGRRMRRPRPALLGSLAGLACLAVPSHADWGGDAAPRLGGDPAAALQLLGAPGGTTPLVPLWPDHLAPGDKGWTRFLAEATAADPNQADTSWVPPSYRPRLLSYLGAGEIGPAARLMEDLLREQGGNFRIHMLTAWLYERYGRIDLAEERYQACRALAVGTADADQVRYALWRVALRRGFMPDLRQSVEMLEKVARVARAQKPSAEADRRLAVALGWRGLWALGHGDTGRARLYFEEASLLAPADLSLRYHQALTRFHHPARIGLAVDLAGALQQMERAAAGAGGGAVGEAARELVRRVRFLALEARRTSGDPDAAIGLAEAQLASDPADGRMGIFVGETWAAAREYARAAEALDKARRAFPPGPWYERAVKGLVDVRARVEELRMAARDPDEVALEEAAMLIEQPPYREAARILRRARRRRAADRSREALVLYAEGGAAWPEVVQFPLERGVLLTRLGRYREGQEELERAREVDPDAPMVLARLAQVILARGDSGPGPAEALPIADRALEIEEFPEALHARGWALAALGNARDGAESLRRAADMDPESPEIQYRLALALMALNLEGSALAHLREAERLAPGHSRAKLMEGLALARLGRREEAQLALSQVVQDGDTSVRRIARDTLARLTNQVREDAGSERPDLAVPPPGLPAVTGNLARTSSELASRRGPAFDTYMRAAEDAATGRLEPAKKALRELAEEHPGMAEPHVALGALALLDGERSASRRSAIQVLDLRPDDPRGLVLAAFTALEEGRPKDLARELDAWGRSPARMPTDPFLERLERRWNETLEVNPFRAEAQRHRGLLRMFAGENKAAAMDLEKAGADARSLRARALLALLDFVRERDGKHIRTAEGLLSQAGESTIRRKLDMIRKEILEPDEVEAEEPVLRWQWDAITASEYVKASPQMKALLFGAPLDRVDASRMKLMHPAWNRVDTILRPKGTPGVTPPPDPGEQPGLLVWEELEGAKPPPSQYPPPGLRAGEGFDLPGEPVFDEGLFDASGELADFGATPLGEPPMMPEDIPEVSLDEELGDPLDGEAGTPDDGLGDPGDPDGLDDLGDPDDLGDLDDLDDLGGLMVDPATRAAAAPMVQVPLAAPSHAAESPPPMAPPVTVEAAPLGGERALRVALEPVLRGRTDLAEARLRELLERWPDWEAPRRDLALLLMDTDQGQGTLELAREARQRHGDGSFWSRLVGLLAFQRGDPDRADRLLRASRVQPRRNTASLYPEVSGQAWMRSLQSGSGGDLAREALARLDFYRGAWEPLSQALDELGEEAEATADLRGALALAGGAP
jgi:tetratricopeptide (TPR) repeat protein